MKTTMQDIYQLIADQSAKAAGEWFTLMSRDNYAAVYLYYRAGELGAFTAPPAGAGWTLGSGERLSGALSKQQVAGKIAEISRRLPFLPA